MFVLGRSGTAAHRLPAPFPASQNWILGFTRTERFLLLSESQEGEWKMAGCVTPCRVDGAVP